VAGTPRTDRAHRGQPLPPGRPAEPRERVLVCELGGGLGRASSRVARPTPPGSRPQRPLHKSGPDPNAPCTSRVPTPTRLAQVGSRPQLALHKSGPDPNAPCTSRVPTRAAVQNSGNRAASSRIPDISTWGVLISGLPESASRFPEKCTVVGGPSRSGVWRSAPTSSTASTGIARSCKGPAAGLSAHARHDFSGRTGDGASAAKPTYPL
jgi:hypothetical protein